MTKPKVRVYRFRGWESATLLDLWEKWRAGTLNVPGVNQLEFVRDLRKVMTERGLSFREKD